MFHLILWTGEENCVFFSKLRKKAEEDLRNLGTDVLT